MRYQEQQRIYIFGKHVNNVKHATLNTDWHIAQPRDHIHQHSTLFRNKVQQQCYSKHHTVSPTWLLETFHLIHITPGHIAKKHLP
jgi:exoribonuclease II